MTPPRCGCGSPDLITYSEALTLAGVYVPFTDIGGAVLRMLAATRGIAISDADAAELTDRFASMPPHPEVPAALRRLRDHGFRLFTLTDNTLEISGRQLEKAGVIDLFERRFSVDETVSRHKPAPEAYHSVASALDARSGRHLPDRVPCLGHARCRCGRLAGRAHPPRRQRAAERRPAAGLHRQTTSTRSPTSSSSGIPARRQSGSPPATDTASRPNTQGGTKCQSPASRSAKARPRSTSRH